MSRLNWIPLVVCIGCSPDPAGVWLLTLTPDEEGPTCTETLTENFTHGYEAGETAAAEWTYEESATYADELAWVEILATTPDQAVLIWGDATWPGNWNSTQWIFSWDSETEETDGQTHIAGYSYDTRLQTSEQDSLNMLVDQDNATGQISMTSTLVQTWEESDLWTDALAAEIGSNGSIPSSSYLVEFIPGSEGETAVYNANNASDCDDDLCRIETEISCTQNWSYTAERTTTPDAGIQSGVGESGP